MSSSCSCNDTATAEKPASLARPNRSRNGASLNRMDTLALNLMPPLLPPPAYPKAGVWNPNRYNGPVRKDLEEIWTAGLAAADPERAVRRALEIEADAIVVDG